MTLAVIHPMWFVVGLAVWIVGVVAYGISVARGSVREPGEAAQERAAAAALGERRGRVEASPVLCPVDERAG